LCKPAGREGLGSDEGRPSRTRFLDAILAASARAFLFALSWAMILHLPERLLPEMIPAAIAGR
jgi:hypothetical protein